MSRPRIAVLNAAHDPEHNRRNFRRELDADVTEFDVVGEEFPETFEFDGCLVTGSRASVYWDEEWIEPTKAWVRTAIDRGLPFLGVCWGHQLLADVLGGRVEPMGEYEIGYREVRHSGDSRLFDGIDEAFTVFTTHSDAVVELPPGAEPIAANDYSNHGFRKGRTFGVQFHPEYDIETAEYVTEGKDLPEPRIQSVLDGINAENYAAACEAKALFDNFLDFVEEVSDAPRAAAD
ncbi:type 1 glutamine amidotransferase [Halostella salina]|uniref:type 1 glutamine amidotransferase n=1 Tax=Halostella salina TaxID=1547897 RepID=UPI000EF7EA76|nr:type 1 glutamine amidotransferase [Halostella salina]